MSEVLPGKAWLFSNTPEPGERAACIRLALELPYRSAAPGRDSNKAIGAVGFNSTWDLTLDKPHIPVLDQMGLGVNPLVIHSTVCGFWIICLLRCQTGCSIENVFT